MPSIELPAACDEAIRRLVRAYCQRTGEAPDDARRLLELSIVARGIIAVQSEIDGVAPMVPAKGRVA